MSTSFGFFSTISSGSIYGKFIGNGSLLTGLPAAGAGVTSTLSTLVFLTSSISTANITSQQGYISSLTVDFLAIGSNFGYVNMGDIIATSLSSIAVETQTLTTSNLKVGIVSSLSFISFPGLQQGYAQGVIAEQSTGTGLQELLIFRGSSASDRIRMQTTGSIVFEPGVGARVFPSAPSNVTPAMIITTGSNVGIGVAAPTVALDVAGAGRFTAVSTNTISTNQVNSSNICNAGFISNNGIFSNITAGAFFQNTSNTGTLGVAGLATLTSISNSGVISTLGLNVGSLSSINISTVTLAAGSISTIILGANSAYITNLFVGTEDFGSVLTAASNITQTGGTTILAGLSVNTISTNQVNSSNICNAGFISNNGVFSNTTAGAFFQNTSNTGTLGVAGLATLTSISNSGVISTLGLNVGSLSSINISTVALAAGSISTIILGANSAYITNLFVGTEDFGSVLTAASNITQTGGTTILAGLSVNTISTNQVNSSNICNAGFISNNGVFSNTTAGAFFQNTSNTGTLGVAGLATLTSISNSGVISTLGLNVGSLSSINISTVALAAGSISTIILGANSAYINNISTNSLAAYEGFFSTFSNELGFSQEAYFSTIFTENLTGQKAFLSSLIVNSLQIGETTGFITMGDVLTNSISTNTLNSSNISNVGNLSNGGSATFFSNGFTAASPSTTNAYPYASFKINSASTNTLTPVTPLLLMTGTYGGSIAGGLTQGVGSVLTLGTIPDGGATQEGYRLTGSNSAFYGNVNMQGNNFSNVSSIYGSGNILEICNSSDINLLCGGNLYMYTNSGQFNGIYNGSSYVQIDPSQNINISSAGIIALNGNIVNINTSTINLRGTTDSAIRIGPSQYQGIAADTTTYGLERSRHEIRFAGYRDAQIDKIGSKIVNINKQTYGNSGLRHLIQSADLAFFTVPPDTADIDNTVERMRITDSGTVGIGITAPTVTLDVAGAGRFIALSTNTISSGTVFGRFIGDGSGITGLQAGGAGVTNNLSTLAFYTSSISSTTIQTSNIRIGTISSQSFLAYPGLQQGYAQTVIAEQSTGTGLQELLIFRGSSASDRIRMQTTGFICFETGVGARTFPSVGSNATPSWMIDVNGCVGVGLIPSGTQNRLDVAGQGRFQTLSTTSIQAGSMNLSVAFV